MMREEYVFSKLSPIAKRTTANIIRELLKSTSIPGMISFGGGVPDPETFPKEIMADIAKEIVEKEYKFTLQYSTTEGDPILRGEYIKFLEKYYDIKNLDLDNVLITSGSQQALDLVGRVFLDEESICAIGTPVYLGAASAFKVRAPKFITMDMQADGPNIDILEEALENMTEEEKSRFKFIYIVSNFDNPTGLTLSLEKRQRILDLAYNNDLIIIEDDPYGALRYEGEIIPTIYQLAENREKYELNPVILLNTFSKILSPGLRMGVVIGDKTIIRRLVMGKQAADLCTSPLTQRLTARYLERNDPMVQIKPTLELYSQKRNAMMESFDKYMKEIDGVTWTFPHGGLFSWVTLPEEIDTMDMLELAKENKIVYIPGVAFSVNEETAKKTSRCMRVSFCLPSCEEIEEGTKRLVKTIKEYRDKKRG